jgi:hypothetical protein
MASDRRPGWTAAGCLRWAACLAVGLAAVHQLRLFAAPSAEGHAPLSTLAVPAGVLLLGALIALVVELLGVRRGHAATPPPLSLRRTWVTAAVALLVLFIAQELIEELLLYGHPGGVAGIFGFGGWIAVPLAVAAGGLIALALAGVRRALRRIAPEPARRPHAAATRRPPAITFWPAASVLARKLASRAPPLAAV